MALANVAYALLAAGGFAAFGAILARIFIPLGIVGGGAMLWLGIQSLRSAGMARAPAENGGASDLVRVSMTTFLLTISNPATLLSFAAIFAGLGLATDGKGAAVTTAGVFTGSLIWWFFLCGLIAMLMPRLPAAFSLWVARGFSLVLTGFGLLVLVSATMSVHL